MAYIGQGIKQGTFKVLDTSGNTYNGSNTTFSLGTQVGSAAQLLVSHDGVIQKPGTDYTLASGGASITFSTAPASGASIFIVEISGAVGGTVTPSDDSVTSDKIADTAVTSAKLNSAFLTGHTDIGANIADADLFLTDDGAGGTLRKTAASRLKTYIGSVGGATGLDVNDNVKVRLGTGNDTELFFDGTNSVIDHTPGTGTLKLQGDQIILSDSASTPVNHVQIDSGSGIVFNQDSADLDFRVESNGKTHMIFVDANNDRVHIGNATAGSAYEGAFLSAGNIAVVAVRDGGTPTEICRNTNDGNLINFLQGGSEEGNVSVSGSTVAYNTFMGAHWSQLADNSKPTILRGTVIESIDSMSTWYTLKFNINEGLVYTADDEIPSGKSIGDAKPIKYHYQEYNKPADKNVGDTVTFNYEGNNFTGTIQKETNLTLPQCKISDTEDSKKIYGVFHCWDDNDDGTNYMNDMSIASLGTYMIRIHKDETVAIGDYIQSKGDGTGKKQADDILRASTIGKVTSTEKVITHGDGSYCVPCTLHCG